MGLPLEGLGKDGNFQINTTLNFPLVTQKAWMPGCTAASCCVSVFCVSHGGRLSIGTHDSVRSLACWFTCIAAEHEHWAVTGSCTAATVKSHRDTLKGMARGLVACCLCWQARPRALFCAATMQACGARQLLPALAREPLKILKAATAHVVFPRNVRPACRGHTACAHGLHETPK